MRLERVRQARLHDELALGGAGDAAFLDQRQEVTRLPEFHRPLPL
jgi:hypothetical protein